MRTAATRRRSPTWRSATARAWSSRAGRTCVRGMQFYRGHLIAYSLGNFANFHNFGGGGILSDSAILHVTLSANRRLRRPGCSSVLLDGSRPPDAGRRHISLVRSLSREDFGKQRCTHR